MNFDEYQEAAHGFVEYEDAEYPFFGLAEEVGEFLGIFAKLSRGDDLDARYGSREAVRDVLKKEAGDVLWQLQECLKTCDISMQEVAEMNLKKLTDRQARGVIKGQGDAR